MPTFRFTGAQSLTYPESRDALGQLLRTVNPGDEREFDEPPDHNWTPAGDGGSDDDPDTGPGAEGNAGDQDDPGGSQDPGSAADGTTGD